VSDPNHQVWCEKCEQVTHVNVDVACQVCGSACQELADVVVTQYLRWGALLAWLMSEDSDTPEAFDAVLHHMDEFERSL